MSQLKHARVIRAYALPVIAFDHLKGNQRIYQHQADLAGGDHTVTNSEALTRILHDHYKLGMVAVFQDMQVSELCTALALGHLVVTRPTPEGVSHVAV
jgi:hypothetical protein